MRDHRSTGGTAAEPPDARVRILMLATNPATVPRPAIEEQAREITEKLRLSRDRDTFELVTCWAVRAADLLQQLNRHRPHVVHFSGHGDADGGIVLDADDGEHRVGAEALAELFRTTKDDIRVVVLDAGYSTIQARAIGRHIDYVIGMRADADDRAATVFAAAFYSALGFHRTVQEAFDQATAALMLHGRPDDLAPELIVRPGANPRVPLYDPARPARARRLKGGLRRIRQVLRGGKIGGANTMIGQAGAGPDDQVSVDQSIRDTRIAGDNTMIGVDLRKDA